MKNFAWGDMNKHLFTTDMKSTTEQRRNTTKVQMGQLIIFIRVTYNKWVISFLQEQIS